MTDRQQRPRRSFIFTPSLKPEMYPKALASGADGLDDIRRLAKDCLAITRPGGWLVLEHGADQADAVAEVLSAEGWVAIDLRRDYAGLARVTAAQKP